MELSSSIQSRTVILKVSKKFLHRRHSFPNSLLGTRASVSPSCFLTHAFRQLDGSWTASTGEEKWEGRESEGQEGDDGEGRGGVQH